MKKYIKLHVIIAVVFAAILGTSCSDDLLEEKLYSQLSTATLPEGIEGAKQLTNGLYRNFHANMARYHWFNQDVPADIMFVNWGGLPETAWAGRQNFHNMTPSTGEHGQGEWIYKHYYSIIAQCNEIIRVFGESTDEAIQVHVSEAKFWRAFYYNELMETFYTVPLNTGQEDLTDGLAKASHEELFNFVTSELESIENDLPHRWEAADYGRPTKWAVKAQLANIYLNAKNWSNAIKYAKDVIDNGGYSLANEYHDAFVDGNPESILVYNNIPIAGSGSILNALGANATALQAHGLTELAASNGPGMAVPFFNSFDENDLRRKDYDPVTREGIMTHGYLYDAEGNSYFNDIDGNPIKFEEDQNRVMVFKFPIKDMETAPGGWMGNDAPIIRLAEVYLTYAEAVNEQNDDQTEALKYVNPIRTRAGLEAYQNLDKAQLNNAILDERGWELYMEGFRRGDLMRHGKLNEVLKVKWEYYLDSPYQPITDPLRMYYPIPSGAMLKNPMLEQNPAYGS